MLRSGYCVYVLIFLLLLCSSPLAAQQGSDYGVIDGKQNPPQVVSSTVNVAVADNGSGNYTLTFDQPVVFFLGTSMTEGPVFDVGPSFLSAVLDSSDRRKVKVNIRYVTLDHFSLDGVFSFEVRLATPP